MRVELTEGMAEAIRQWVADSIAEAQPRLCCEIDSTGLSDALDLLHQIVSSWQSTLVVVTGELDARKRSALLDMQELRSIAEELLAREGTLSVTDVQRKGGATFDVTLNEGVDRSYSFLAAAWGEHEESVRAVLRPSLGAHVFRGN